MRTVLVVDDEKKITEVVKSYLEASGYKVICAYSGEQAINKFNTFSPDLVILDLMLPDITGEEVCNAIRKSSKTPIIMLTAKNQEEDMIKGLDLGADDYIRKPFSPKELMGRVRAIMRRCEEENSLMAEILKFNNGRLEINDVSHEVKIDGQLISITPNEYKILITLCKNPSKVFSREDLVVKIFGYDYAGNDRAIDTHIKNLRQKIEQDSKNPEYIITIHGVGYRFGGN